MFIRANQKDFMDNGLNEAVMVSSKPWSNFLKLKSEENRLFSIRKCN